MRKFTKILSFIIAVAMIITLAPAQVKAADKTGLLITARPKYLVGDESNGFVVKERKHLETFNQDLILLEHVKTGAKVLYYDNEDTERTFTMAFKTPAYTDKGFTHIIEHCVLDGSEKYPSRDLFFNLSYQTYNTYMNALTYQMTTMFPCASLSEEQLIKLADYYTSSVLEPKFLTDESIFREEAWRYVLENPDDELTVTGTVYNEMKGHETITEAASLNFMRTIMPGSKYSTESGGEPSSILTLTYDELCNYYRTYYTPSNSLTSIYGKFESIDPLLEMLNGYFSRYEKKVVKDSDSNYRPLYYSVNKTYEFPLEEGAATENTSVVYYGFVCKNTDVKDIVAIDYLTTILNDESSEFKKRMKNELPVATAGCYCDYTTDPLIYFYASNINESDVAKFKKIVDESVATTLNDGFDMDAVKNIVKGSMIDNLLLGEGTNVGISMTTNLSYYWANLGEMYYYLDYIDDIDSFGKLAEDGTLLKYLDKYVNKNYVRATVLTVPAPGKKEKDEKKLADSLAAKKAKMSAEEIQTIVDNTAAVANRVQDDTSAYIKDISAVSVKTLPEEIKKYAYTDKTDKEGIRRVDITTDTKEIASDSISLNACGLTKANLQYLQLYTDLLSEVDSTSHTSEELRKLLDYYMYSYNVGVGFKEDETPDGFTPYLAISFMLIDEDVDEAYKLLYEYLFETKFDDVTKIKNFVERKKASIKSNWAGDGLSYQLYRGFSKNNAVYGAELYIDYVDYYKFLDKVSKLLDTDPKKVTDSLVKVQKTIRNRNKAVTSVIGNEDSIKVNRKAMNAFLKKLKKTEIKDRTYKFEKPKKREAYITDSTVNFNMVTASLEEMGLKYNADLIVFSSLMSDAVLYPVLRSQYGAYGAGQGASEEGIYIYSYRDPNVKESFELYDNLASYADMLAGLSQEDIDGYILSTYSSFAQSSGEIAGAKSLLSLLTNGKGEDYNLKRMKQLKKFTPAKALKYVKAYKKMMKNGNRSTSGGAGIIKENKALFDKIYDYYGTGK